VARHRTQAGERAGAGSLLVDKVMSPSMHERGFVDTLGHEATDLFDARSATWEVPASSLGFGSAGDHLRRLPATGCGNSGGRSRLDKLSARVARSNKD
jgi:hypothetical protein